MEPELRAHLLACASAYAKARSLELVTVAQQAAGDWRFFDRMVCEKNFTVRKYDEVMRWFQERWPEGLPWPTDVPLPAVQAA